MKKHCRGEKTGLKTELKISSFFLLSFFLITESYSQIPINGFCKFDYFAIDKDLTSLYSLNFNKDSQSDLLLYNSQKKVLFSFTGDKGGSFKAEKKFSLPYEITNLYNVTDKKEKTISCAFTSRKNRTIGFYDFYSNGKPKLKKVFKFDSYPENLSIGDINESGNKSYLVSGSAFNGLVLLGQDEDDNLQETKIVSNKSFRDALFVDITNDNYPDIVASNILERSIDFYYNNGSGEFTKIRSIKVNGNINKLQSFDINLDQYTDLIFSSDNSITIYYGDSVGSFDKRISVKTTSRPDKFILGDFNHDGHIDIAYIDIREGTLSLIFANGEDSFYPELIYLKKDGLTDLIPFYSKFINGITLISNKGFLYSITNLSSISEDVSLVFGGEPGAITYFDMDNNGIIDIACIDKITNSLELIIRNNAGIPWMLYNIKLFEQHSEIVVNSNGPFNKTFYCYTPGKKIIEIIEEDFKANKINRSSFYSPGNIEQVMDYSVDNNKANIFVSYLINNKLGVSVFQRKGNRFANLNFPDIASNVFNSSLSFSQKPKLFYWERQDSLDVLYSSNFSDNFRLPSKHFQISSDDTFLVNTFSGDLLNKDEIVSINFIQTPENDIAFVSSLKNPSIIVSKDSLDHFRIKNKNLLFFGELKPGGLKKLFIYVPDENALHKVDLVKKGKEILVWKLLVAENVESYFIKNLNSRDYHFVYSDSADGCIKIKQITQ
ncbi:MAG TPA: VCBS repeat-containing protein [Ignavibacteriaceae bacterium]|nr:VCBS repeat-containing protein [Ignavibacteriaceae bacterium]